MEYRDRTTHTRFHFPLSFVRPVRHPPLRSYRSVKPTSGPRSPGTVLRPRSTPATPTLMSTRGRVGSEESSFPTGPPDTNRCGSSGQSEGGDLEGSFGEGTPGGLVGRSLTQVVQVLSSLSRKKPYVTETVLVRPGVGEESGLPLFRVQYLIYFLYRTRRDPSSQVEFTFDRPCYTTTATRTGMRRLIGAPTSVLRVPRRSRSGWGRLGVLVGEGVVLGALRRVFVGGLCRNPLARSLGFSKWGVRPSTPSVESFRRLP